MYYYICTSADYVSMCTSMCCIDSNGETSRIAASVYRVGLNAHVHYWRQLYICFLFIFLFFFFVALRAVICSIQWQFSFVDLIFYPFNPDNDDSIASELTRDRITEDKKEICFVIERNVIIDILIIGQFTIMFVFVKFVGF